MLCLTSGASYIQYQPIVSIKTYSPNCWQHITNTIIHFQKCTFPNLVPEGHTETIQLTFITQVLAWYIQYQHIYSTDTYSPNCWQHISNTNKHFRNCTLPNPVPEGHTETLQLTFSAQVLAWYIQYQYIYSTDTYSPNCWQHISNINIYMWLTCTPQIVGSISPIQIYNFKLIFLPPVLAWYIQYQYIIQVPCIPQIVGSIYPIQNFNLKNVHPPTLRQFWWKLLKDTTTGGDTRTECLRTACNNCPKVYIVVWHYPPWLGKEHSNRVQHSNHSQTPKLTFTPQVFAS